MIFVTCGTQDKEFKRLFEEVEKLIKIGKINEKVIAQIGHTKFTTTIPSDKMQIIKFCVSKEMQDYIRDSELIITHGGVGTIIEGINNNKKIIAVPRLKKYKEHVNDHQLQIIENFSESGYIIGVKDVEQIEYALEQVKNFKPKTYESNNEIFLKKLEESIND